MIRWLLTLTLTGLAACSPAQSPDEALRLCPPVRMSCGPAYIEYNDFWSERPSKLAPDEIVVEATDIGGRAHLVQWRSSETGDDHERACTKVSVIAIHRFRISKVVSGVFNGSEFALVDYGYCSDDDVSLGLIAPKQTDKPAYLVIHPIPYPEGVQPYLARWTTPDLQPRELPLMRRRVEHGSIPCDPRPGIEPAPDCPVRPAP